MVLAAKSDVQEAIDGFQRHRRECPPCQVAVRLQQYGRACDSGWAWLKWERQAAARLRALESDRAAAAPVQLALF